MKPATALPWYTSGTGTHQGLVISEVTAENVAVTYNGQQDAAYIAHACNAYPELLRQVQELREAGEGLLKHVASLDRPYVGAIGKMHTALSHSKGSVS